MISKTIKRRGFTYTQYREGNKSFIYIQIKNDTPDIKYYEVFIKRIAPDMTIAGKFIPAHYRFPWDEAFGEWAWSYKNLDKALKKFNEIENEKVLNKQGRPRKHAVSTAN